LNDDLNTCRLDIESLPLLYSVTLRWGLRMTRSTEEQKEKKQERAKRHYVRPRLKEYGSVAKLTESGGSHTPTDGAALRKPGA
ncbi:MAG: hypothetical protein WA571_17345, partial [Candidatus Binatus sp.]